MYEELEEVEYAPFQNLQCPKKAGRYKNPYIDNIRRRLWDFFLWKVGKYDHESFRALPPQGFHYPNPFKDVNETAPDRKSTRLNSSHT